jgi:hypothetical protein
MMRKRLLIPALLLVAIVALLTAGTKHTFADERDFTLINGSASVTIVHVYVSPSSVDNWEEDVLGQDVLLPGDSVNIHFSKFDGAAGQCSYDIRVDGNSGEQGFLWNADLCSTDTVTFS